MRKARRPAAAAEQQKRHQLAFIASAEVKELIVSMAQSSGRTQSQVVELLIERAITYDRTVASMNRSLDEIRRGNIEGALRAEGYVAGASPYGKIWYPPGYPLTHRSGFIPLEEGQ
jgi:hypothetical protein